MKILSRKARDPRLSIGLCGVFCAFLAGCGADGTPPEDPTPDDSPSPEARILTSEPARVAFNSRCALNVLECAGSRPTPNVSIEPLEGQFLTVGDDGMVLAGPAEENIATVQLQGSGSIPGTGASAITYSWSSGASDEDPDTFAPGSEFSREPDPGVRMERGFHYIRLTVCNGSEPRAVPPVPSDLDCDFREVQLEVRVSDPSDVFGRQIRD